jgi:hypothetical protein
MIFTLGPVWYGPVTEAVLTLLFGRHWSWAEALTRGGSFGASMVLAFFFTSWLSGTSGERRAVRGSIVSGALPPGADPGEWQPRLRSERARLGLARWIVTGFFVVEAVLLAAAASTTAEGTTGLWLATLVATACAVASPMWGRRARHGVEQLLAKLPQP